MAESICYKDIPYYSELILDYLEEKQALKFAYNRFSTIENFKPQLEEKKANYPVENRAVLVEALKKQYKGLEISELTQKNIEALKEKNTFTITTGHQLNLFTGPLYFFYKIISVLNLTQELKATYPEYNFVPMYWLASEDHDFEEISFFNFKGKKYIWETSQSGAVGRFSTEGMDKVYDEFSADLNTSDYAEELRQLFKKAYLEHKNLTQATRFLANELLGKYGLVIIDGDDTELKSIYAPYVKDELLHQTSAKKVEQNAQKLSEQGYKVQVNPREINLFYLGENSRERILKEENTYSLHDSQKTFTETELLTELESHPERFSPNAILRPLYQEVVLPNLCYIGGSGELAYWLELKEYFKEVEMSFPILLMRNSALLLSEKQAKKLHKLKLDIADLFLPQSDLLEKKTRVLSTIKIDFSPQRSHLKQQFEELFKLAQQTDKSFYGAVAAQEKKQLNGLDHLEKRLLKAQKKVLKNELARSTSLQEELFPQGNLQERTVNFSEIYEAYGQEFIEKMMEVLKPLSLKFDAVTL